MHGPDEHDGAREPGRDRSRAMLVVARTRIHRGRPASREHAGGGEAEDGPERVTRHEKDRDVEEVVPAHVVPAEGVVERERGIDDGPAGDGFLRAGREDGLPVGERSDGGIFRDAADVIEDERRVERRRVEDDHGDDDQGGPEPIPSSRDLRLQCGHRGVLRFDSEVDYASKGQREGKSPFTEDSAVFMASPNP